MLRGVNASTPPRDPTPLRNRTEAFIPSIAIEGCNVRRRLLGRPLQFAAEHAPDGGLFVPRARGEDAGVIAADTYYGSIS